MKQYQVTGMSCAACSARVEQAVSAVEGVTSCSVSLLTNSMGVEGTASEAAVIQAVTDAGYGASVKENAAGSPSSPSEQDLLADHETPALRKRLLSSLVFLLILLYFSMGHSMWGWPVPAWFSGNPAAIGLLQMILAAIIMIIHRNFFRSGWKSALHRAPNMDTLVALGSSASFFWSVYALFRMTGAQAAEGSAAAAEWTGEFYFESAAMILVLISIGKMLEAKSKGRTTDALKSLIKLAPNSATVIRNGKEYTIPTEEVTAGDIFTVKPGESIPVDGIILEGDTAVNESALTGESIPVDKTAGDSVSAATVNQSGFLRCRATRVGADTTLSRIIKTVSDAAATKAPIAKIADKVSGVFVPIVIGIALITLTAWLLLGKPFDFSLARAISVLVISCPCALGLATPVAIMVGSGVGARHGILFKTAEALEEAGKVQILALDKTGTITRGEPEVTALVPADGISEEKLLTAAYALEQKSEHPLARAIVREAERRGMQARDLSGFHALPGHGLSGKSGNGKTLFGGSLKFMRTHTAIDDSMLKKAEALADRGCTPVLFTEETTILGIIAIADPLKPESREAVTILKNMGISIVMLTGDHPHTAQAIGQQAGINHVIAEVLPEEKAAVIARLKKLGRVAMVGDGINDAPALTVADTGIAIGAGTDIAIDAANLVLMNSKLSDAAAAIRLSRASLSNIRENLFWAFFYNALCIPLAAGCYIGLFGWALNPMIGAAAMSLSSACVVSNALRLNFYPMDSPKRVRKTAKALPANAIEPLLKEINTKLEEKNMTKTIRIEGMMCPHCEAHTKKALEAIDGVKSAEANHTDGKAVVTLLRDVNPEILKAAVEDAGYTVLGIE